MKNTPFAASIVLALAVLSPYSARAEPSRDDIAAPAGTIVMTLHAVGAQIYECKVDPRGDLLWMFREPLASLIVDGKTVGRHFAGPTWEMADGSRVIGKVVAQAAAASTSAIPWLKLDVSDRKGSGDLDGVTTVQRVGTVGGRKSGPCPAAGELLAEPYAADYVFSRP